MDEGTRQESLDHVGFLFAYIADKDIFHKYYSKLLSKRIIQLTSVSDEAEERMLKNMRKASRKNVLFIVRGGDLVRCRPTLVSIEAEERLSRGLRKASGGISVLC